MTPLAYDELLTGARRLLLAERLRLASALDRKAAGELSESAAPRTMTPAEALVALDAVRAHFAVQGPVSPTLAQLARSAIAEDLVAARR